MSDLNKRIPELAEILAAKSYFQMVIYSPDSETTYRIDVDKLLMAEAAAFDGYIIYDYTGASGSPQTFTHDKVMVEEAGVIYKLLHPARPYGSVDLAAELAAGHWVAIAGGTGGGATYLNDLLDVTTDTASTGQVLYRSGLNWINRTLTAADVGALSQAEADLLYASITHNHDGVYSPVGHDHDSDYAPITHNHDGLYSPVAHTHSYALNDLTDVTISGAVNGQVIKLVNGVWTNADESGTPDPTGAVLLAPSGAQTINQGTSKFGVNRTGSFFGGNYTQQLIFDEDLFSWRFNTALDSSTYYSRLNVTPYSLLYQATSGSNAASISGSADGSETKVELSTSNSQWQTTTYNSDQYTVMYWTIGDGQIHFDSDTGEWDIRAKSEGSATTGTFSVRPDGLYWNNALLSFGGGGASALNDLTDVTITTAASGNTLRYNGSQWVNYVLSYSDVGAAAASHTHAFSSLTGVSIGSPTTGQYLQYNGTNWVPATMSAANLSLDGLNDVTIASVAAGQLVYFNGTQWINRTLLPSDIGAASTTHNHTLGSLTGVSLSNTTSGQYLTYNGTSWVNSTLPAIPTNLDSLTDVVITSAATNQFLRFNGTSWVNQAVTVPTNLDSLTDVVITTAATNQILQYNGSNWVNAALPTIVTTLDGLSDVVITTPSVNQILSYNGTAWVNNSAQFLPLSLTGDTTVTMNGNKLTFSSVTSGTLNSSLVLDDSSMVFSSLGGGGRGNIGAYGTGSLNSLRTTGPLSVLTAMNSNSDASARLGATVHLATNEPSVRALLTKTDGTESLWEMTHGGQILFNGSLYAGGGTSTGATNLDGLTDVTIAALATNQFLRFNGTQWVNQTVTIPTNLDSLSDVVITSAANQHILIHNGTNFVNQAADAVFLTKNFVSNQSLELNGYNFTINQNGFTHMDLWGPSLLLKNQGTATGQILSDEGVLYMTGFTQLSNRNDVQYYSGITPNRKLIGLGNSSGSYVELNAYAANGGALIYTQTGQMDLKAQGNALEWYLRLSDSRRSPVTWKIKEDGIYRNDVLQTGAGAGAQNLDGLSDVTITSATSGQVLRYNGSAWVNAVVPDATTSVSGLMSGADKVKLNTHVRSKTPITLTDAATTNFDLAAGYNFKWAISAGAKTINPTGHEDGDNWAIDITGCAGQVVSFGPTAGYTHRLAGTTGTVTGVTLPATGTVSLMGRRMGTEIRWSVLEF